MFGLGHKTKMIDAADALPGRSQEISVPDRHAVLGTPLWLAAKVYGVLFGAVAAVLAWRLALRLTGAPIAALATGALTALDGRLLWAAPSGMEVTLFATLSLAAFLARPSRQATGDRRQAAGDSLRPKPVARLMRVLELPRSSPSSPSSSPSVACRLSPGSTAA